MREQYFNISTPCFLNAFYLNILSKTEPLNATQNRISSRFSIRKYYRLFVVKHLIDVKTDCMYVKDARTMLYVLSWIHDSALENKPGPFLCLNV